MNFKIEITRELVAKSLMAGTYNSGMATSENCVLANALKELFPRVTVSTIVHVFDEGNELIGAFACNESMIKLILDFDTLVHVPQERYTLVGRKVDVDIPDRIINKLYSSHVEMVQKIADSPTLKQVTP